MFVHHWKIEMNIVIGILLFFALFGAVDKIFLGKWGVAEAFDQGLATMGNLCLSMSGIYCIAITFLPKRCPTRFSVSAIWLRST